MENAIRILHHKSGGYAMDGAENWKDYRPVLNGGMIAHDLFHHRIGESGFMWEEARALGARLVFEKETYRRLAPMPVSRSVEYTMRREGLDIVPALGGVIDLPADALEHYTKTFSDEMRNLCLSIISSGYTYALAIGNSVEAYDKIERTDWAALHKQSNKDLRVNIETGTYEVIEPVCVNPYAAHSGVRNIAYV